MAEEILIASSSIDGCIRSWNLQTGSEYLRYKSCASTPHGLTCIKNDFIASSQICDSKASSGSIFYWSWSKPQVEVKSFLEEPLKPVATNSKGTYLVGGGLSGNIYFWEVSSGKLRRKWFAHYRAVTCLVFNHDGSLLISGSEDGSVRVWSLFKIINDTQSVQTSHLYEHNFLGHTLCVTDIVVECNAVIISASEDCTCKVWSLSEGSLLASIVFPSVIDAIALGPREHGVFYAGSRDGIIYIASLNADSSSIKTRGFCILDSFSSNNKAISCLEYSLHGNLLLAGSEDGIIRVWDPATRNIVRIFKYGKGPVKNMCIVEQPSNQNLEGSHKLPSLRKYVNLTDGKTDLDPVVSLQGTCDFPDYIDGSQYIANRFKDLQQQGSSAVAEMELGRQKNESKESNQQNQKWKKMSQDLLEYLVNELLDTDKMEPPSKP